MLQVEGLSKRYRLYRKPHHRILSWLNPRNPDYYSDLWAVRNVSFELGKGEGIGVVGWNGSGKTTLLRLISGVTTPTSGRVELHGETGVLLSATVGMNKMLSGARNLILNAPFMGIDPDRIRASMDEIRESTGLHDMLDHPVRTYSPGMRGRLAFALTSFVDAPILLMDEITSGGDKTFRLRATERLKQYREAGKTIVIATHKFEILNELCQRVLWLHEGRVKALGPTEEVLPRYEEACAEATRGPAVLGHKLERKIRRREKRRQRREEKAE